MICLRSFNFGRTTHTDWSPADMLTIPFENASASPMLVDPLLRAPDVIVRAPKGKALVLLTGSATQPGHGARQLN